MAGFKAGNAATLINKSLLNARHRGGILSNFVIEPRSLTHVCCERTNNCRRGTNS
jgi:hypothetical protein